MTEIYGLATLWLGLALVAASSLSSASSRIKIQSRFSAFETCWHRGYGCCNTSVASRLESLLSFVAPRR